MKPTILVGMDAHTQKLALCVSEWYHGSDPHVLRKFPYVSITDMETIYQRHIPQESLTLIEASGNTVAIKDRLEKIGYKVFILRSDILKSIQKQDKVNDLSDAEKLCFSYARGNARDEVWTASPEFREYREILSARKRAVCDTTRISNRISGFYNLHGYGKVDRRQAKKLAKVDGTLKSDDVQGMTRLILQDMKDDYEHALKRRQNYELEIMRIVVRNRHMLRLMQLPGIGPVVAFAIVTFVEDVRRFENPKKLVAYFGANPIVNSSGQVEERQKRKGKEHGHISDFGRSDLKGYCTEMGQAVLRRDDIELAKWGHRLLARGKLYNKVVMAVARKTITYAWHMLMEHETPSRESEALFKRKLANLYRACGKEFMQQLGYKKNAAFADAIADPLYAHLPERDSELQTAASPASV